MTIPLSARPRRSLRPAAHAALVVTAAIGLFGFVLAPLLLAGTAGACSRWRSGLSLMGLTYGPLGTALSELFPTSVRYTGSSLTFNLAGIFGASLAPYIATWLAKTYGLPYVGYYLTLAAALTLRRAPRVAGDEGRGPRRSDGSAGFYGVLPGSTGFYGVGRFYWVSVSSQGSRFYGFYAAKFRGSVNLANPPNLVELNPANLVELNPAEPCRTLQNPVEPCRTFHSLPTPSASATRLM